MAAAINGETIAMTRYKKKLGSILSKQNNKQRSHVAYQMVLRTGGHAGTHHNRDYDVVKGKSRKAKHKGKSVSGED